MTSAGAMTGFALQLFRPEWAEGILWPAVGTPKDGQGNWILVAR